MAQLKNLVEKKFNKLKPLMICIYSWSLEKAKKTSPPYTTWFSSECKVYLLTHSYSTVKEWSKLKGLASGYSGIIIIVFQHVSTQIFTRLGGPRCHSLFTISSSQLGQNSGILLDVIWNWPPEGRDRLKKYALVGRWLV